MEILETDEYHIALNRIRKKASATCQSAVSELYGILKEKGKHPKEIKILIENDLGDIYKKSALLAALPDECKDTNAAELGRRGGSADRQFTKETNAPPEMEQKSEKLTVVAGSQETVVESSSTDGDSHAGNYDPDLETVTVPRQKYEMLSERERTLNQTAQEAMMKLHRAEEQLRQERELKIGLQDTIQDLRGSLEAKQVEAALATPKSAVSPPQQMKMDQYFKDFSDIVATAHTEHCPAGCSTWQKASTITITR